MFVSNMLRTHLNVDKVSRRDDILFDVHRVKQCDNITVLCCDEYTLGITIVRRGFSEFASINIFYAGGVWAGYTSEAKKFCTRSQIGLYNANEISGGLWKDEFWNYAKKIRMEITSFTTNLTDVIAVYGFGSFFKENSRYNDIDTLIVVTDDCNSLEYYYIFKNLFFSLEKFHKTLFHPLLLTESEFISNPLRDMNNLAALK